MVAQSCPAGQVTGLSSQGASNVVKSHFRHCRAAPGNGSRAHGLICRVCEFQVGKLCFHSHSPCTAQGQQVCETTKAYIGKVPLFSKYGCSRTRETCNMTEQKDAIFEVSYNRTCCESDLCNAAGPPRATGLPLLSGLGALLGWWLLK